MQIRCRFNAYFSEATLHTSLCYDIHFLMYTFYNSNLIPMVYIKTKNIWLLSPIYLVHIGQKYLLIAPRIYLIREEFFYFRSPFLILNLSEVYPSCPYAGHASDYVKAFNEYIHINMVWKATS